MGFVSYVPVAFALVLPLADQVALQVCFLLLVSFRVAFASDCCLFQQCLGLGVVATRTPPVPRRGGRG